MTHPATSNGMGFKLAKLMRRIRRNIGHPETLNILSGPGKGLKFKVLPNDTSFDLGINEVPVQEAFAGILKPGQVFFDIGANFGFFTIIGGRLVGKTGQVIAFEPVPGNARTVRYNIAANQFDHVTLMEMAVAEKPGRGKLFVTAHSGGSTLASVRRPQDTTEEIEVTLESIDSLRQAGKIPAPDVVKIDVEGAEMGVLLGMTETISNSRPTFLIEVDDAERTRLDEKKSAIMRWLRERGYGIRELPDAYPGSPWHVDHIVAEPEGN